MSKTEKGIVETTELDFAAFKASVEYWLDRFGLKDWKVGFSWEKLSGDLAGCSMNLVNRSALFKYTTETNLPVYPGELDPDLQGFHEVCELLTGRLRMLATVKLAHDDDLDEATHEIIRTLENVFYRPKAWEKGVAGLPSGVHIQPVADEGGDADAVPNKSG